MTERDEEYGYGTRFVGTVRNDSGGIQVEHIYGLELHECEHGKHHDAGQVSINLFSKEGEFVDSVFLESEEALRLAFLIERTVGFIEDNWCELPDVERESARWETSA